MSAKIKFEFPTPPATPATYQDFTPRTSGKQSPPNARPLDLRPRHPMIQRSHVIRNLHRFKNKRYSYRANDKIKCHYYWHDELRFRVLKASSTVLLPLGLPRFAVIDLEEALGRSYLIKANLKSLDGQNVLDSLVNCHPNLNQFV